MPDDSSTRTTVATLLRRSQAHAGLSALEAVDPALAGRRSDAGPHSLWELVEHLRLTAEDLLAYIERSDYEAPDWPDEYWPGSPGPGDPDEWTAAVAGLRRAIERMAALVEDPDRDLHAPAPSAEDPSHHLLRCALVLLDHDAYHLGQVVDVRRALDDWPPAD